MTYITKNIFCYSLLIRTEPEDDLASFIFYTWDDIFQKEMKHVITITMKKSTLEEAGMTLNEKKFKSLRKLDKDRQTPNPLTT